MTSAPSVKDVARLAGVSTATVSRVLNKSDSVSKETRDTVLQAAQEVGYRINRAARSLRLQRTGAIAVLIPNVGNPFFSNILAGIESVMTSSDMNVLILDSKGASSRTDIADYLTSHRADGIICLDGSLIPDSNNHSTMLNLPLVFGCEWPAGDGAFSSVRSDNAKGAALAIEHLVSLGHTKIACVRGPAENVLTTERQRAVVDTLRRYDIPVNSAWFFNGDFSLDSGARAAEQWCLLDYRPTAIFCFSDLMAIGAMAKLIANGIKVPDDVSVVGFDDIDIARHYVPALTTIRQQTRELGVKAANALFDRLNDTDAHTSTGPVVCLLEVDLIERSSTGPVPA